MILDSTCQRWQSKDANSFIVLYNKVFFLASASSEALNFKSRLGTGLLFSLNPSFVK
jgi:hypothetical protein